MAGYQVELCGKAGLSEESMKVEMQLVGYFILWNYVREGVIEASHFLNIYCRQAFSHFFHFL